MLRDLPRNLKLVHVESKNSLSAVEQPIKQEVKLCRKLEATLCFQLNH